MQRGRIASIKGTGVEVPEGGGAGHVLLLYENQLVDVALLVIAPLAHSNSYSTVVLLL